VLASFVLYNSHKSLILQKCKLGFLLTLVIHCRSDYWYGLYGDGRTGRIPATTALDSVASECPDV